MQISIKVVVSDITQTNSILQEFLDVFLPSQTEYITVDNIGAFDKHKETMVIFDAIPKHIGCELVVTEKSVRSFVNECCVANSGNDQNIIFVCLRSPVCEHCFIIEGRERPNMPNSVGFTPHVGVEVPTLCEDVEKTRSYQFCRKLIDSSFSIELAEGVVRYKMPFQIVTLYSILVAANPASFKEVKTYNKIFRDNSTTVADKIMHLPTMKERFDFVYAVVCFYLNTWIQENRIMEALSNLSTYMEIQRQGL